MKTSFPAYKPDYEHIYCDYCNGTIGIFVSDTCSCQECGKIFSLHKLAYDRVMINDKTGWIFPVRDKKEELLEANQI